MADILEYCKMQLQLDTNIYDQELTQYIEVSKQLVQAGGVEPMTSSDEYYGIYKNLIYYNVVKMFDVEVNEERIDNLYITQMELIKNATIN